MTNDETMKGAIALGAALVIIWAIRMEIFALK
jgi:hypothetical protein